MDRKNWLVENQRKEVDVMWDEDGREYIVVEPDEEEGSKLRKVYLPDEIQMSEEEHEANRLTEHHD